MTYEEFSAYIANYGFTYNPIAKGNWPRLDKLTFDQKYGLACDLNAGIPFERALRVNSPVARAEPVALEATHLRGRNYIVRPEGQLGTAGFDPIPWTAIYVKANSPEQAADKARGRAKWTR
jgi:hypothetical protein